RTMFSLTHSGISVDDVYAYFYDEISHTWRPLIMVDKGNSLVGVLEPTAGQDIYEGFEDLTLIIVITHFDGACKADCWVEIAK
ncbi:MAG: hypothetical protein MIO90_05625, partial [Methanomassiliicoccales archaeon]|nr:hypothetical protein [Methanomassiliicoccales archaeon]